MTTPETPPNGIPLPRRISYGALTIIFAVFVQFIGVVLWASNEHNDRVELQHRFEEFVVQREKQAAEAVERLNAKNRDQDAIMAKLLHDSERLPVIEERANLVLAAIQEVRRQTNDNAALLLQLVQQSRPPFLPEIKKPNGTPPEQK